MLLCLFTGFLILAFLFLLDLNELRKNTIEKTSLAEILGEDNAVIDRIDGSVKPYLKRLLKVIDLHTNLPYEYNSRDFNDMNSLQVVNDFAKKVNITTAGDLVTLVKVYGFEGEIDEENSDPDSDNESRLGGVSFTRMYNIGMDMFKDNHNPEINTK